MTHLPNCPKISLNLEKRKKNMKKETTETRKKSSLLEKAITRDTKRKSKL